eukprot:CAMPEP_0174898486 /NCGR_PEP_ID=MMETSP0167-20121228/21726_1 /TAXON_ID=38298 /ORGANISM="Rhodella maculata, Strain CCMP736" /LENGTH=195 /DNA_ID=CAMNT_0016139107 /DNA_START=371 /DNA_END=958 /DNA_ORIENTATION=-
MKHMVLIDGSEESEKVGLADLTPTAPCPSQTPTFVPLSQAFQGALSRISSISDELLLATCVQELNLVPIIQPAGLPTFSAYTPAYNAANAALVNSARTILQSYVNRACADLRARAGEADGVDERVRGSVLVGLQPRDEVVALAGREGVDVCWVGSRGLGSVKRLMLGSFSSFAVSHMPCSVMVVKKGSKNANSEK